MRDKSANLSCEEKSYWVWAQRHLKGGGFLFHQQIVIASEPQEAMAMAAISHPESEQWQIVFSGTTQFIAKTLRAMKEKSQIETKLGYNQYYVIIEDRLENIRHPGPISAQNIYDARMGALEQFRSRLGLTPDQDKDRCYIVGIIEYSLLASTFLKTLGD